MPTIAQRSETNRKLTIMGYGAAMRGKTRFLISIRRVFKGPCYIFNYDMEDNLLPLMTDPSSKDIEYDQYDHDKGYDNLVKKIVELKRSCKYEVLVLENINRLYRNTMEQTLRLAARTDLDGARIQDWGLTNKRVYDRLKDLLSIEGPECIYVTTHESIEKDETTGRLKGDILVPSKQLPNEIPPLFNLNLHFCTRQVPSKAPEYYIQCAGDGTWDAGDKTGTLNFIEEPDFVKLYEKIAKNIKVQPKSTVPVPQPKP